MAINKTPCKGKRFVYSLFFKAFALTGRQIGVHNYQGDALGYALLPF